MEIRNLRNAILASLVVFVAIATVTAQRARQTVPTNTLLKIIRYEDQRNWTDDLKALLSDIDAKIRKRTALAAGRIGDERAIPSLNDLLLRDGDNDVRQMAAFALGEIESPAGANALLEVLGAVARSSGRMPDLNDAVRARAVEALGKVAAALPESEKERKAAVGSAILRALKFEDDRRPQGNQLTILLGLTATLRARPEGAGPVVIRFLDYPDPRIVAGALNTMARLRLKDGNERVRQLLNRGDAMVRANAARVIGAAEHKEAFDDVLSRALNDSDPRVRVSAIRALGSLKDARAARPLITRAANLLVDYRTENVRNRAAKNELLEIITTVGRVLQNSNNAEAIDFLKRFRILDKLQSAETEIAFARVSPETYLATEPFVGTNEKIARLFPKLERTWRASNSLAQGLAEFANLPADNKHVRSMALMNFALMIEQPGSHDKTIVTAIPTYLRAYAAFKNEVDRPELRSPKNAKEDVLSRTVRAYVVYREETAVPTSSYISWREDYRSFGYNDVFVRATAAELLGDQPPSDENTHALITALSQALRFDKHDNDAALAILDALGKQKSAAANDAIKTALDSSDHLLRRKAVALLKANGGNFSDRIGLVKTRYADADYRRAIARIGRKVTATVVTSKGSFTIEFLPEDAPLTVDNFIQLAKKGFFNGQMIPRVVPNFVIQAGDPRGDQNGGPGYQIRCEINEVPYDRAAVGMALSGKDTGGSQWFVTHSPQPHLDGGYTVFGRVIRGMEVVDNIARGDVIRRVIVNER